MVRNHNLAKAISDCGWGQFCTMLKHKAECVGKVYLEVDRFFPSSKTCNNYLHQMDSLSLHIRNWQCPNCQTTVKARIPVSLERVSNEQQLF